MKSILVRVGILTALLVIAHAVSAGGFPEDAEFVYRDINELEIDAAMFDLRIESVPGNEVRVEVLDIPRGITVSEAQRGGRVHVYVRGRDSWFFRSPGSPRMIVEVPAGINLDIENGSGETQILGVRGELRVRSGSGDVGIVDSGGSLVIEVGSGEVCAERIVGDLVIETGSGDVEIEECLGVFSIDVASGSIDGTELELRGDSRFRTASGDIDLELRNDLADVRYEMTTAGGDLRWGDIRGERRLTGGAGRIGIVLESASGSIEVR